MFTFAIVGDDHRINRDLRRILDTRFQPTSCVQVGSYPGWRTLQAMVGPRCEAAFLITVRGIEAAVRTARQIARHYPGVPILGAGENWDPVDQENFLACGGRVFLNAPLEESILEWSLLRSVPELRALNRTSLLQLIPPGIQYGHGDSGRHYGDLCRAPC